MTNLTRANYHSIEQNKRYMSVSQYKQFDKCEARALAIVQGKWTPTTSDSLLVGQYVDEWLNGELDRFKAETPELFNSRGDLRAPFKKADELIERLQKDTYMMKLLTGKRQVILTGMLGGVEWKVMLDSMLPSLTVDGKVMKDCDDMYVQGVGYVPFWKAYGYDIQGAVYQTIRAQNEKGKVKPFELAVITKEEEPDLRIFRLSESTANAALGEVRNKVQRFAAIKDGKVKPIGCGHCDYCRAMRKTSAKSIEEF